jgi:glycyl-tRNA synthetase beta chain
VLDLDRRKEIIKTDASTSPLPRLTVIHDEGSSKRSPASSNGRPMLGSFELSFLELPEEVIIATIRANQKCFCLRDAYGKLANKFILTANTIARTAVRRSLPATSG